MTTSRRYTLIVPRVDHTGPCNVAVDLARAAAAAGWAVQILYLSGTPSRDVGDAAIPVRRVRFGDLFSLRGVLHTHCLRPDLLGALLRRHRVARWRTGSRANAAPGGSAWPTWAR